MLVFHWRYSSVFISGAELEVKATQAVDAAKETVAEIKSTAEATAENLAPKVDAAVHDGREAGRSMEAMRHPINLSTMIRTLSRDVDGIPNRTFHGIKRVFA